MSFKRLLEDYQKTFILNRALDGRLSQRPLYLKRCLRYMEHYRIFDDRQDDNELNRACVASLEQAKPVESFVDNQAERTFSILPDHNIKLKFHHIDQIKDKAFCSVEIDMFVVRASISDNNDLYKAFVGNVVFMDLTDIRNNTDSELVIDCERLWSANEDYAMWDYSLALVVRYFEKENMTNDELKEELFITEILFNDFDQQEDYFFGEHEVKLNIGDIEKCTQKKINNYDDYIWMSIDTNDVLYEPTPGNYYYQSCPKIKFTISNPLVVDVPSAIQPRPSVPSVSSIPSTSSNLTYTFVGLQSTQSDMFKCPFCSVDCNCFKALFAHLEACHSRFVYKFNETSHKITVSLNGKFDGSLEVLPRRLNSVRKWPVGASLLVSPMKRALALQCGFRECDLANLNYKKERIYYNKNKQPMHPGEEYCGQAYQDKFILRHERLHAKHLDDITDVNRAEKELMKMCNKALFKWSIAIPCSKSFPRFVMQFVRENGKQIIKRKLKLNFMVYLSLLVQMQLIDTDYMFNIATELNN